MVQKGLHLGSNSPNGLRFDINSYDTSEQNIVIVLKERISDEFVVLLSDKLKRLNRRCNCDLIGLADAQVVVSTNVSEPQTTRTSIDTIIESVVSEH
ncbi:unnamed protein product [Oppiella nova]|uniref:Uncharacterized protein n=1 Tax=Oppiella nova TaxID=334625 RepID=A0A7R9MR78_9ACAR|nr:unnamed protein product [Oppiella nova]CAG2181652.1 unnamed protein product [Oppiella nova]